MKKVTDKKELGLKRIENSIENLARMTAKGFASMATKNELVSLKKDMMSSMDSLEVRLTNRIDEVEGNLTSRIQGLERRMDDISLNKLQVFDVRLTRVEKKVGIVK